MWRKFCNDLKFQKDVIDKINAYFEHIIKKHCHHVYYRANSILARDVAASSVVERLIRACLFTKPSNYRLSKFYIVRKTTQYYLKGAVVFLFFLLHYLSF